MNAMDAVKEVMKINEITPAILRKRLGIEKDRASVLSQRFTQKNVSVRMLSEMLRVMDYKIIIVPCDTTLSKNWMEIE